MKQPKNLFSGMYRLFFKILKTKVFDRVDAINLDNFLQSYIHSPAVPRSIRLDQARCKIGQKKNFCKQNKFKLVEVSRQCAIREQLV